jgi:uncharacterized protein involved in exopolysaccharide biosynthesis
MKATIFTMFCLSLQPVVLAQDAPLPPCDAVKRLDAQATQSREELSKLLISYTELHPAVIAKRKNIEELEAARAAQVALAKSQGIVCPTKPEIAAQPPR